MRARDRSAGVWRAVNDDGGSTLIELAFALPVFFLFSFGLVNFALIMFGVCNITFAAQAASRYVCLHSSTSYVPATSQTVSTMVLPYIFRYPSNSYSTNLTYGGSGNVIGGTASVSIKVTYNISLPFYTYNGLVISSSSQGTVIQ